MFEAFKIDTMHHNRYTITSKVQIYPGWSKFNTGRLCGEFLPYTQRYCQYRLSTETFRRISILSYTGATFHYCACARRRAIVLVCTGCSTFPNIIRCPRVDRNSIGVCVMCPDLSSTDESYR